MIACHTDPKYWLFHPDIYPAIKDDRNPDDIDIPESCIFHYYEGGMIAYHRVGERWRVHPHIHPKYRHLAKFYVLDSLSKIDGEVECSIPVCFRHVKIFALQCGGKVIGTIAHNYQRDGIFYDSILMVKT